MSSASTATPEQLAELKKYTSCDISDALLRLKVPNSGFIADLHLFPSSTPLASPPSFDSVTVAPASTFLFIPKTLDAQDKSHGLPEGNIPSDSYWVDETQPGTIVVMSQPKGQINAVLGGIMAFRMKVRGAKGVVVSGRVRDMGELAQTEMPVSSLTILAFVIVLHEIPSPSFIPAVLCIYVPVYTPESFAASFLSISVFLAPALCIS